MCQEFIGILGGLPSSDIPLNVQITGVAQCYRIRYKKQHLVIDKRVIDIQINRCY